MSALRGLGLKESSTSSPEPERLCLAWEQSEVSWGGGRAGRRAGGGPMLPAGLLQREGLLSFCYEAKGA